MMSPQSGLRDGTEYRMAVRALQRAVDARRQEPHSRSRLNAVRRARAVVRAIERGLPVEGSHPLE